MKRLQRLLPTTLHDFEQSTIFALNLSECIRHFACEQNESTLDSLPFPFFSDLFLRLADSSNIVNSLATLVVVSALLDKLVSESVYWILKVCTYLTMSWFVHVFLLRVYCFCGGGNLFGADQRPSSDSFVCAFHNASVLVFVVYLI